MNTAAFEFEGETKYLVLPGADYTDEQLAQEALRAIYWQVVIKRQQANENRTPDECMNEAQATPWQIVNADTLPKDRTFRSALIAVDGKFDIDLSKAQEIQLSRIRSARDAKLKELDTAVIIALGKGDSAAVAKVEAQKQILRDIPQALDLSKAQTPEELKATWPEELK